jgi:O-antigen ligase
VITYVVLGVACLALILAALMLVFGCIRTNGMVRERSQWIWMAMLTLLYLCPAASILASGRNLRALVLIEDLIVSGNMFSSLISKAGYYGLLALSTVVLLNRLLEAKHWPSMPPQGRWLLASMMAYVTGSTLGSAAFGTRPFFMPSYLGASLLFPAVALLCMLPAIQVLQGIRNVLVILVFASLAAAIALPTVTLETYTIGMIPGFPLRFWGLTLHANTMGPLAALGWLLCVAKPFSSRRLQFFALFGCLLATVLAQSKTTWLAILAAFFTYMIVRNLERPQDPLFKWLKLFFAFAAISIVAFLVASGGLEAVGHESQSKELGGGDFSGRTAIWEVAVNEWRKNPLFGYGPSIWSPEYRAQIGMNFAFHAHNQFYQTLSEAGAVGLFLLLGYIFTLASAVIRDNPERALGIAVLCFVLIRSISEPAFRTGNAVSGDAMVHLVLLGVAVNAIRSRNRSRAN